MISAPPTAIDEKDANPPPMNPLRRSRLVFVIVLLAAMLFAGGGFHVWQQERLRLLHAQISRWEAQMPGLKLSRDEALHQSELALRELDTLEREIAAGEENRDPDREAEILAWLEQVKAVKELFEQRPDQKIPELTLLPDREWLRVVKAVKLDSDEHVREALAAVRDSAKNAFAHSLSNAFVKFTKATNGQLPATIFDLAASFETPVDMAILQRYNVIKSGKVSDVGYPPGVIRERTAIDEDYDQRLEIQTGGGMSMAYPPLAWIDDSQRRMQLAYKEFTRVNNGAAATSLADVVPFINPPLSPVQLQKVLKAESKRQR